MPVVGPDEFGTQYEYIAVSGRAQDDCCVLGYRAPYEQPFSPFTLESWAIFSDHGTFSFLFGVEGWLTGLWRSPRGELYVANNGGMVHLCRKLEDGQDLNAWQRMPVDLQPLGIWGLPDGPVYVWGRKGADTVLHAFDGKSWNPMPCPGAMSQLHGLAPDRLYAGGYEGLLASWDGRTWTRHPLETRANLTGLSMVSEDEIWATTEGGELLEGSRHGWAVRARAPEGEPLFDVARWQGDLWVAGGDAGLLRLVDKTQELEVVKPTADATTFDARQSLLMVCQGMVAATADGKRFQSVGSGSFLRFRSKFPPMWEGP